MRLLAGLAVVAATHLAYADRRRVVHLGATAAGGAVYAATETFLKSTLAPAACRICDPTGYDRSIRDAVRWSNTGRADTISNVTGYALAPIAGLGWLVIASSDHRFARWLDDAIPVIETAAIAGLLNQTVKFAAGEQRPFVHFAAPGRTPDVDDNVSFYSGHTTLAFGIATSAGEVARRRGYRLAPLIFGTGYALAATTGYLRVAADRHYFTDVAVGALTGIALGFAVPAVSRITVVPTHEGAAIAGRF